MELNGGNVCFAASAAAAGRAAENDVTDYGAYRVLHDVVTDEVPTSFEAPSYNKSEWQ